MFLKATNVRLGLVLLMIGAMGMPTVAIAAQPSGSTLIAQAKTGQKKRIAVLEKTGWTVHET